MEEGRLVISPARKARSGWAEAFQAMAQLDDDEPLEGWKDLSNEWDEDGWEWR